MLLEKNPKMLFIIRQYLQGWAG